MQAPVRDVRRGGFMSRSRLLVAPLALAIWPLSVLPQTGKVYEDKVNGFKITLIGDVEHEEEEAVRAYRSGFELAAKEAFGGGTLRGMRLAYYYVDSGRKIAA